MFLCNIGKTYAEVVKQVDTGDLKSPGPYTAVRVQVPSSALHYKLFSLSNY
jgi:hypothetical protein